MMEHRQQRSFVLVDTTKIHLIRQCQMQCKSTESTPLSSESSLVLVNRRIDVVED